MPQLGLLHLFALETPEILESQMIQDCLVVQLLRIHLVHLWDLYHHPGHVRMHQWVLLVQLHLAVLFVLCLQFHQLRLLFLLPQ